MSQFENVTVAYTQSVCLERISSALRMLTLSIATLIALAVWHNAHAQQVNSVVAGQPQLALAKISDVGSGGLLLKTSYEGYYLEAPALATNVEVTINGLVARTKITQRFENPSSEWIEGLYVFPLPDMSAVDTLRMQIGERFIEGDIKERQEARRVYEAARNAGQRTSLIEQERPNIFTNSVANIGPGETVIVQIEYQESIRFEAGQFHLRFPMVVGPRFIPPVEPQLVSAPGGQHAEIVLRDPVPDAARITPPVLHPAQGPRNPIQMTIQLDTGFPIDIIRSAHHDIRVKRADDTSATITFVHQDESANRDFELVWQATKNNLPRTALFKETIDGKTYLAGLVVPTATVRGDSTPQPRSDFCHRQFRVHGRCVHSASQRKPAIRSLHPRAGRPVQRDPV